MNEGKDIYYVSAALCVGVIFASTMPAGLLPYLAAGACISLLCIVTLASAITLGVTASCTGSRICVIVRSPLLWTTAFFILGMLCHCTRSIVSPGIQRLQLFSQIQASLGRVIDTIPFNDRENNALVKAIITGDRSSLSAGTKAIFRSAGAAHLLALSGMHLGYIYLFISKALAILGNSIQARQLRSLLIILATGFYSLVCGAGPSLSRAWLFIALNEGSKIAGRPQDSRQIFCVALLLHLVFKSECIRDLGFQLSYLAMVGIVFVWPHMRQWYGVLERKTESSQDQRMQYIPGRKIWDILSLSICAQLFTAPLTLLHFGTFPNFFLITNLSAAPLMSILMLGGIAATAATMAAGPEDAEIFVHICEAPATMLRALLQTISEL